MIKICPECRHDKLIKDGHNRQNKQVYCCSVCGRKTVNPIAFKSDKKNGVTNWREWSTHLKQGQELHEKASRSQDKCDITIKTDKDYIIYQPLSDLHIGAIGCNYEQLENFTDNILKHDNLYFSTLGDHTDNFNQFKNMYAVHQMQMSPAEQQSFFEDWVEETKHKFLFSTWGNHEEMEERSSGINSTKNVLNRQIVYFNGIGVCNLHINDIDYKIVATHKTRYNSSFNITHGLKQMARKEISDADIYMSGHVHNPAVEKCSERGLWQWFLVMGSLKKNDGYAKRYFTYWINSEMPCLVLGAKEKEIVDFLYLKQALKYGGVL
jgi:predicted phosphodiesterase